MGRVLRYLTFAGFLPIVEIDMSFSKQLCLMMLFLSSTALSIVPARAESEIVRIDFCQLTGDPASFQGKKVLIAAYLRVGPEYGDTLASLSCRHRPVVFLTSNHFRGWSRYERITARYASFVGPVFVELDGYFVYRTDVSPEEYNPFVFCATRLRNAISADWDADEGVAYKVYSPSVAPNPLRAQIPCSIVDER